MEAILIVGVVPLLLTIVALPVFALRIVTMLISLRRRRKTVERYIRDPSSFKRGIYKL